MRELVLAIGIPLVLLLLAVLALEHRHRADHWSVAVALVAAALRFRTPAAGVAREAPQFICVAGAGMLVAS